MATQLVGDTSGGGSTVWSHNYNVSCQFTAIATGTMNKFDVDVSGATNIKPGIYADSSNLPGSLLGYGGSQACVAGINRLNISDVSISSSTVYWLSANSDTQTILYTSPESFMTKYKALTYANALPDPFGTPDGSGTTHRTHYAGYNEAAAAVTVVRRRIFKHH